MTTQPEALIHAEWLEKSLTIGAKEAAAELRRLHAENEALRADAERYRWLKNHSILGLSQFGLNWSLTVFDGVAPDALCEIDAAIDAARSET